jgi:hypothetical protein
VALYIIKAQKEKSAEGDCLLHNIAFPYTGKPLSVIFYNSNFNFEAPGNRK